jgi:uncharacterized membrane protein
MNSTNITNISPILADSKDKYQPGVCNIGKEERDRRLRSGLAFAVVAAAWPLFSGLLNFSLFLKILVFFPTFAAAIGLLQVYFHFCAYFGLAAIFNFGTLNDKKQSVLDKEARKLDQDKALKIILYAAIIAIFYTLLAVLLT